MKIIVSSKNLKKSLKSIFEFDKFSVILKHDCIEFFNEEFDESFRTYGESKDIKEDFNLERPLKNWIKIYNICKDLDEQPIVLLFESHGITITGIMI